jgi:hypothetical protein
VTEGSKSTTLYTAKQRCQTGFFSSVNENLREISKAYKNSPTRLKILGPSRGVSVRFRSSAPSQIHEIPSLFELTPNGVIPKILPKKLSKSDARVTVVPQHTQENRGVV